MLEELLWLPTDKCNIDGAIYLIALYENVSAFYDIYYLLCVSLPFICYKWLLSSEEDCMPEIMAARFCQLIIGGGVIRCISIYLTHWRASSSFKCVVNITRSIFQILSYKKKQKNLWQHHFITHTKKVGEMQTCF